MNAEPLSTRQLLALSDRQIGALRARASYVRSTADDFDEGIRDAAQWLADRLNENPQAGQRYELRKVLREYATTQVSHDSTDKYEQGWVVVLGDVLAILDGSPDVMTQWTAIGELKAEKESAP